MEGAEGGRGGRRGGWGFTRLLVLLPRRLLALGRAVERKHRGVGLLDQLIKINFS